MPPRSLSNVPLPDQSAIEAVRISCSELPAGSTLLAERFYQNLFKMAPDLRSMFAENLHPQHKRMADALLQVVHYLDAPDDLAHQLRVLGAQHRREYGVEPRHYPYVGRALIRAVSEISPTWSSSMSSSWVLVYEWITANMLAGAEEPDQRVSGAGRGRARPARSYR
ncbi:globin domain-containing protein [Nocardiopsis sp. LOL_012]|uniref:globin domain-containing protein n=1 Tax=Nocardiopsis sp. LOL_012 TaxID=3345409 RepID=UPI003A882624